MCLVSTTTASVRTEVENGALNAFYTHRVLGTSEISLRFNATLVDETSGKSFPIASSWPYGNFISTIPTGIACTTASVIVHTTATVIVCTQLSVLKLLRLSFI